MGDRPLFECIICHVTGTLTKMEMRRHVAIFHSAGVYSTISCGVCEGKFFDLQHFKDHTNNNNTSSCSSTRPYKMNFVPLPAHVEDAFLSLVDQMIRPVNSATPAEIGSEKTPDHQTPLLITVSDDEDDHENGADQRKKDVTLLSPNWHLDVVSSSVSIEERQADTTSGFKTEGVDTTEEKNRSLDVIVKQEVKDPMEGDSAIGASSADSQWEDATKGGDAEDGTGIDGRRTSAAALSKIVIEKCQALLQQRYPQLGDSDRIECFACGNDFQLPAGPLFDNIALAIRHACAHSRKLFFQCQICDRKFLGSVAYQNHLRHSHHIPRQQQQSVIDNSVQMPTEDGRTVDVVVDVFRRYFIDNPKKKNPRRSAKNTRTIREAALLRAAGRKREARSARVVRGGKWKGMQLNGPTAPRKAKLYGKIPREDQIKAGHTRLKGGNVEDPKKISAGKQKNGQDGNRRSLLVGKCLKIVRRVQFDDHRVRCRICGVTVKTQGGHVTGALSHACKHAQRLQLNCQFCPFRAAHPNSIKHHTAVLHNCVQPSVSLGELLIRAGSDLYETFLQCFDDGNDHAFGEEVSEEIPGKERIKCGPNREQPASSKEEDLANIEATAVEPNRAPNESRRSFLLSKCHKIVKRAQSTDHHIRCRMCGLVLKTHGGQAVDPLNHACKHAQRLQLRCQTCRFRYKYPKTLRTHMIMCHKSVQPTVTFGELLAREGSDLYETFLRCFDYGNDGSGGSRTIGDTVGDEIPTRRGIKSGQKSRRQSKKVDKGAKVVSRGRGGRRLIGEKEIHALALIRKYANGASHLTCKLCSKPVRVICFGRYVQHSTAYLVAHAIRHTTDQCLYRCGVCRVERATSRLLKEHSRKHHPDLPYSDTCVDRSHEFEDRIIQVMSACFDCPKRAARLRKVGGRPKPDAKVRKTEDDDQDVAETAGDALVFEEKVKLRYNCSKCSFRTRFGSLYRNHTLLMHK